MILEKGYQGAAFHRRVFLFLNYGGKGIRVPRRELKRVRSYFYRSVFIGLCIYEFKLICY